MLGFQVYIYAQPRVQPCVCPTPGRKGAWGLSQGFWSAFLPTAPGGDSDSDPTEGNVHERRWGRQLETHPALSPLWGAWLGVGGMKKLYFIFEPNHEDAVAKTVPLSCGPIKWDDGSAWRRRPDRWVQARASRLSGPRESGFLTVWRAAPSSALSLLAGDFVHFHFIVSLVICSGVK